MKTGTKLGILAFALAIGGGVLWFYLVRQVNLPDNRILFVVAFAAAVILGVAAFFKGTSWAGAIPAVLAILVGAFFNFTIAISPQETGSNAIRVGDTIPRFSAPDDTGEVFDSGSLNGHLVLIKFFRAHW